MSCYGSAFFWKFWGNAKTLVLSTALCILYVQHLFSNIKSALLNRILKYTGKENVGYVNWISHSLLVSALLHILYLIPF